MASNATKPASQRAVRDAAQVQWETLGFFTQEMEARADRALDLGDVETALLLEKAKNALRKAREE